jgi:hypothetical protein
VAPPDLGGCSSCDVFQLARDKAAGSPSYRVPKGKWRIIKWSAQGGGTAAGSARLRVYRETDVDGQYKLVKESDEETIPADGHPRRETSLRVRHGDMLGLTTDGGAPAGFNSTADGDIDGLVGCDPTGPGFLVGMGTACAVFESPSERANVWAKLEKR